jgi:hypothetical protein
MVDLDTTAEKLSALSTGSVSVFDVVMQMNSMNQVESGLDLRTWVLVRLGALAATGGTQPSYLALLAMCEDDDISVADLSGALVAAAPVIGSPRLATAALNLAEAVAAEQD